LSTFFFKSWTTYFFGFQIVETLRKTSLKEKVEVGLASKSVFFVLCNNFSILPLTNFEFQLLSPTTSSKLPKILRGIENSFRPFSRFETTSDRTLPKLSRNRKTQLLLSDPRLWTSKLLIILPTSLGLVWAVLAKSQKISISDSENPFLSAFRLHGDWHNIDGNVVSHRKITVERKNRIKTHYLF